MKVNTVGKELTLIQKAYLAGFLDADGAIMAIIEKHNEKKFGFRVRVILKITQKDKNVLKWFAEITNCGSIVKNRETFDWIIRTQKENHYLLLMIVPFLRVKNKQAKIAIDILEKNINEFKDLLEIASLADLLSSFNVRSKNRRKNFVSMIQKGSSCND